MRLRNPFVKSNAQSKATISVDGNAANTSVMRGIQYTQNVSGRPSFYEWDISKAIDEGFKASTWVYTSVNKISRTAASVDWIVFHKNKDGSKGDRWPDHPFEQLMKEPNPFTNGQDWRERTYQHLWLGGNAVSRIVSVRNVPVALVQMMPHAVKPVPDDNLFLAGYDLYERSSAKSGHLENNEVLHLMFTDPSNMYWGISPLMAVARTVDTDNEAVNWNKVSLQNRAAPDGVFTANAPITVDEWNDLRTQVRDQGQGSNNAHNPWVLGYGMSWQPMSLTPVEMDFLETRKNNRTEILAVYGMPPPMAGIYDEATYNNVHTARLIWWLDTIIPFLEDIRVALEFGLARRFGTDFIIDYDLSKVDALKVLQMEKIDSAQKLWTMGVPLEIINTTLEIGLPDNIPGANRGYLPLSLYPLGSSNPPVQSTSTEEIIENSRFNFLAPPTTSSSRDQKRNGHYKESLALTDSIAKIEKAALALLTPETQNEKITLGSYGQSNSPEARKEYYKAYDKTRIPWERKLQSLAEDQYIEDIKHLANVYEKDGLNGIMNENLATRVKWKSLLFQFSTTLVQTVGTSFYNEIVNSEAGQTIKAQKNAHLRKMHKRQIKQNDEFNWEDPAIFENLDNWTAVRAGHITDTTMNDILNLVDARSAEQYTPTQIAKEIRGMTDMSTYRSTMISRTEVSGMHNYAHTEAAKQSNVIDTKTWISSGDDRVRDNHKEENIAELSVPINEPFRIGASILDFPGDPSGDPAEIINCRCALAYEQQVPQEGFLYEPEYEIPEGEFGWNTDIDRIKPSSEQVYLNISAADWDEANKILNKNLKEYQKLLNDFAGIDSTVYDIQFEELDGALGRCTWFNGIDIDGIKCFLYQDSMGKDLYDGTLVHEMVHARTDQTMLSNEQMQQIQSEYVFHPGIEEGVVDYTARAVAKNQHWEYYGSKAYDAYVTTYSTLAREMGINPDYMVQYIISMGRTDMYQNIFVAVNEQRERIGLNPIPDLGKNGQDNATELYMILCRDGLDPVYSKTDNFSSYKLAQDLRKFLEEQEQE